MYPEEVIGGGGQRRSEEFSDKDIQRKSEVVRGGQKRSEENIGGLRSEKLSEVQR